MRLFISSTVYDLIDVRTELAEFVRSLGVTPILSDDKLSEFKVSQAANSIETCLLNVESCDSVLVILDKRYGPSLKPAGFEDLSATHLEYRRARKRKKPIHMYVRDRLAADYALWKKNKKRRDLKFAWIPESEVKLFPLIEEHSRLVAKDKRNNWYSTFTSVVDLKAALKPYLNQLVGPKQVRDAINENKFPIFRITTHLGDHIPGTTLQPLMILIDNISLAPAFKLTVYFNGQTVDNNTPMIAAGTGTRVSLQIQAFTDLNAEMIIKYDSVMGVAVVEKYAVKVANVGPVRSHGAAILLQQFRRCEPLEITILDKDGKPENGG